MGMTPTASRQSCPVSPALTTRVGGAGTLVFPNACSTVTEPSSAMVPGGSERQPVAASAAPAVAAARNARRDQVLGTP
jgi:hypothetical protein